MTDKSHKHLLGVSILMELFAIVFLLIGSPIANTTGIVLLIVATIMVFGAKLFRA